MADARIVDRGYRPYDGPRSGTRGAVRSLAWHSVLRALGLKRSPWAKVFPALSVLIAYLPAAVFVGVAALLPENLATDTGLLPTYADYYGFISAAIIIFVALVGPEVLCTDRRNGMLGLYLASPLTRATYLGAKVLAVAPVLALVTLGPLLLLLVGLTFADAGPDGMVDFLGILARMVAGGVVISVAYTAISLAAASLTDRRAVASAAVILLLLVSASAASTLVGIGGDTRIQLLNLFFLPFELVQRIYGQVGEEPAIATLELVAATFAWTAAAAGVVWGRYRRLQVAR
ncbi:MAG TPA: ABC transporter permease [Acidimicrobiales bacterium]|nr:ABC transporter permease [Acidimicrobiales bacterium]